MKVTRRQIQHLVREILSEAMDPELKSQVEIAIDQASNTITDELGPHIAGLRDSLQNHTESETLSQIFDRLNAISAELSTLKDSLE